MGCGGDPAQGAEEAVAQVTGRQFNALAGPSGFARHLAAAAGLGYAQTGGKLPAEGLVRSASAPRR